MANKQAYCFLVANVQSQNIYKKDGTGYSL